MVQDATLSLEVTAREAEILTLDGAFDVSNVSVFHLRIADVLAVGAPRVIVDLRGVTLIDSAMLAALVNALRAAERRAGQGSFRVIRPNPFIWRVFVLAGLSGLFPAFSSLSEALADPVSDS
jgi:anti-anti-sigma factor